MWYLYQFQKTHLNHYVHTGVAEAEWSCSIFCVSRAIQLFSLFHFQIECHYYNPNVLEIVKIKEKNERILKMCFPTLNIQSLIWVNFLFPNKQHDSA